MEAEADGRDGDKELGKGDGGGAEGASQFPAGIILSGLEDGEEGGLSDVGEPDLGGIGENGGADGVKDFAPGNQLQAPDGVSEDAEGVNQALDMARHGADVKGPVELGGKEDPKVADGLGDGDTVGCGRARREEDGGRGKSEVTGREVCGVEEHELSFVEVDKKSDLGEPGADSVPGVGDLGCGRKECGARGVYAAVVNIKGEVFGVPEGGEL